MSHRLLLVEDQVEIGTTVCALLQALDYDVEWVQAAETALDAFRHHPPDVVLTDIELPGMNGIQLLQELLRLDPQARVIAMSGSGPADPGSLLDDAKVAGAVAALPKPFQFDELVEVLRTALPE